MEVKFSIFGDLNLMRFDVSGSLDINGVLEEAERALSLEDFVPGMNALLNLLKLILVTASG